MRSGAIDVNKSNAKELGKSNCNVARWMSMVQILGIPELPTKILVQRTVTNPIKYSQYKRCFMLWTQREGWKLFYTLKKRKSIIFLVFLILAHHRQCWNMMWHGYIDCFDAFFAWNKRNGLHLTLERTNNVFYVVHDDIVTKITKFVFALVLNFKILVFGVGDTIGEYQSNYLFNILN